MPITQELLTGLGVPEARASKYLPLFEAALPEHGIDKDLRLAHFLAQILHESASLKFVEENLKYSAEGLRKVFSKYYHTDADAAADAYHPERIANRVYANRIGNGAPETGDGYRYRGRGFIQLTGKANYQEFATWVGDDVVAKPDLVSEKYPVHSALHYWSKKKINTAADADDVVEVTRLVNGGKHGLKERTELLAKAKRLLGIEGSPAPVAPKPHGATHKVTASTLNLRSAPVVRDDTKIGLLHEGAEVEVVGSAKEEGWSQVRALVGGAPKTGYVSTKHLAPL